MYNAMKINDVKTAGNNLWFGDWFTDRSRALIKAYTLKGKQFDIMK